MKAARAGDLKPKLKQPRTHVSQAEPDFAGDHRSLVATGAGALGIIGKYGLMLAIAFLALFPLYWLVVASFIPVDRIFGLPPALVPVPFTIHSYLALFSQFPFVRWFANSVLFSVLSVTTVVAVSSLTGWAFAQYRFRGDRPLFVIIIASQIVPFYLIVVPLYVFMIKLTWTDTYLPLIIPWMASPFGVFLMRQYMLSIPTELLDAARIDGATEFGIFRHIGIPLSGPAMAALATFQFVWSWNAFLWPVIILRSETNWTLPVGIASFVTGSGGGTEGPALWGPTMAASALTTIPIVIVFLLLQRYFMGGLTVGAVKG